MSHDFNKPPHVTSAEEVQKKKRNILIFKQVKLEDKKRFVHLL